MKKGHCCSAARLLLPFSTSQNLEVISAVKMGAANQGIGLNDRYSGVFHCRFCTFVGLYPKIQEKGHYSYRPIDDR
jgi:hypothetical protein